MNGQVSGGKTRIPVEKVLRMPPGQEIVRPQPGDFILLHGTGRVDRMISWGQSLRIHGADRQYARWTHAALITDGQGTIVEAQTRGVGVTNLEKYLHADYTYVGINALYSDRMQAVAFARSVVGAHYGFAACSAIALAALTGCKLRFNVEGEMICSALVARALERTGAVFNKDPSFISPADLAKYYGALSSNL